MTYNGQDEKVKPLFVYYQSVHILWSTYTRGATPLLRYPPIAVAVPPIGVAVPPIAVAAHLVTKKFCSIIYWTEN